jgi:hypothetical protein
MSFPVIEGLDEKEVRDRLDDVKIQDRTFLVFQWLQQAIILRHQEGGLNIPPPILGRVFQEMSTGMLGFQQCLKIQDTPFPFPYVQICLMALTIFNFICGFFVHEFCRNPFWAFVYAFVAAAGFSAINEVSIQLEDPFGEDENDLPMHHYQLEFNKCLMQISFMDTKKYKLPGVEQSIKQLYEEVAASGHDFDAMPILPPFQTTYQKIEPFANVHKHEIKLSWARNMETEALRKINKWTAEGARLAGPVTPPLAPPAPAASMMDK